MYLVQLSDTEGINLAHVIEWSDFANYLGDGPALRVRFSAPSENMHGQRQPHESLFFGEQRRILLQVLANVQMGQDWKTAYEDMREEQARTTTRLWACFARMSDEDRRAAMDEADQQETAAHA